MELICNNIHSIVRTHLARNLIKEIIYLKASWNWIEKDDN